MKINMKLGIALSIMAFLGGVVTYLVGIPIAVGVFLISTLIVMRVIAIDDRKAYDRFYLERRQLIESARSKGMASDEYRDKLDDLYSRHQRHRSV